MSQRNPFFIFQDLPFETVEHRIDSLDVQTLSKSAGTLLVIVTGLLAVSGLTSLRPTKH